MAINFYAENATGFVRDFGLMSFFMDELGLPNTWRRIFLVKLSLIHKTAVKMSEEEARKGNR